MAPVDRPPVVVERQHNVFGFVTTVRVEVAAVAALGAGMQARLEHQVELGLRACARRVAWYVIEWPKRQAVLKRLSQGDAEALGVLSEWRRAREGEDA